MTDTHICICKYPLMIFDTRDTREIEYLAMPIEVIKDGDMPIPEIDFTETEGLDGITRSYVVVKWQQILDNMHMKRYDVVGHIVVAGCELSTTEKGEDGMLSCTDKSIYEVYHPLEEWIGQHIVEISPGKKVV